MEKKLTFWEWMDLYDHLEGEELDSKYTRQFYLNWFDLDVIHSGDCTHMPWSCVLCQFQDLMEEYKLYTLG